MLSIDYDAALLESAVRLAAGRNSRAERVLYAALDPVYQMADPKRREHAFHELFRDWFRRLSLDQLLPALLAERPLLMQSLARCIVREAPGRRAEGAELLVREGGAAAERTLLVQLCPASLVEPAETQLYLRRELLHAADIVDDSFKYDPLDLAGVTPAHRLMLDRYRIIWDLYVEIRLIREGHSTEANLVPLSRALKRACGADDGTDAAEAFIAHLRQEPSVTHPRILHWAQIGTTDGQQPIHAATGLLI